MKRSGLSGLTGIFWALLFLSQGIAQEIDHWETVVFDDDTWRYLVPVSEPATDWRVPSFDDTGWPQGPGGFGYGDDDDGTVLEGIRSVFQRITFSIPDVSTIASAVLHMDYDDGFVAYLNDVEIARGFMADKGDRPAWDAFSSGLHEAALYQGGVPSAFEIPQGLMIEGDNVLAIQTHNDNPGSSDLSSRAFISVGLTTSATPFRPTPFWFEPPKTEPDPLISNLPIIVIDTDGLEIPNEPKIAGRMGIIFNGEGNLNDVTHPFTDYDGYIGIERRGSSSQSFPKLNYAVETRLQDGTDLDTSLLGFPEEEDWVLHGPYSDKSLLRNLIIYTLANRMGRYATRTQLVELVLNNDYRGVYVLMEKIKRDSARVDVSKLNPDEITGDDLTGGYIIKIDKWDGAEVDGWFSPYEPRPGLDQRVYYQYHYPKPSDIVQEQRDYIQGVVAAFEDVMAGPNFDDPEEGYTKYIDVDSAIDFCILNELTHNVDGYRLSTFFYKDKDSIGDGKLFFGPIWDFNLGFGNADYYGGGNTFGFQVVDGIPNGDGFQPPFWFEKLFTEREFNNQLRTRWNELRAGPLHTDSLMQLIDEHVNELTEPARRNFERWQVLDTYIWPNTFIGGTYEAEIGFLKQWIRDRLEWMDANLVLSLNGEDERPGNGHQLSLPYPNPVRSSSVFSLSVEHGQTVRIGLYDVLGREVDRIYQGHLPANAPTTLELSAEPFASGIYLLRVVGESFVASRQVVIAH